jgi:hypothetical protein
MHDAMTVEGADIEGQVMYRDFDEVRTQIGPETVATLIATDAEAAKIAEKVIGTILEGRAKKATDSNVSVASVDLLSSGHAMVTYSL